MAKKMADCIAEAVRGGYITPDEGKQALDWYNNIRAMGADDAKAKVETAAQLEAEARERERRKVIMAGKLADRRRELSAFRNAAGDADYPTAHRMAFFRRGDEGKFIGVEADSNLGLSIKEIEDGIMSGVVRDMEEVAHEFRRGAITGDIRRTSKTLAKVVPGVAKMQARLLDVTRAMRGEKVADPRAQEFAEIMMNVAEKLRLRFNEAGGAIGKLDGWGGPQAHNAEAILLYGRDKWVEFITPRLNRDKMVHPLTGRKLTDAELKESLEVSWKHIVDNGYIDEEKISGVPVGKGALWSRHADHRFLHFKSADAWLEYATQFGNRDPYASFMSWVKVMSRDIAAMEKFGPNPETIIAYEQQWIRAMAKNVRSTDALIKEHTTKLDQLFSQLVITNPDLQKVRDRLNQVYKDIDATMKTVPAGWRDQPRHLWPANAERRIIQLEAERLQLLDDITKFYQSNKPATIEDVRIRQEITDTIEELHDPIQFATVDNPVDYAERSIYRTNQIWGVMKGASGIPVNTALANQMRTIGGYVSLTMLPGAFLSALADPVFGSTAMQRLGFSFAKSNPARVLIDTLRNMSTASRREAMQNGVIWESALGQFQMEAANASKWAKARATTSYMADRVHAIGLLTPYTNAGKASMQMKLMAQFANAVGTAWNDLQPEVKATLERGGFDAMAWNKIQNAELHEPKPGAPFLRPNEIHDVSPELAERYIAMIARETRYAVIEPTPESRAFTVGTTRPGTVPGELLRAGAMLKGFPIAVLFQWWGQMSNDIRAGDHKSAISTGASLIVTGALMGIFAMAMKDIYAGRDPRKWFDEETYLDWRVWVAAIIQAGGGGIYTDLFFSEVTRTGGSLSQTLAGPMAERADSLIKLTFANAIQAAQGKDTHFGRELTRVLRQNFPNVLWTKLLVDRMVFDQFQRMVDPEAQKAFRTEMSKRKKDYGQDYYWAPGETRPSRAPDLSRMFATRN